MSFPNTINLKKVQWTRPISDSKLVVFGDFDLPLGLTCYRDVVGYCPLSVWASGQETFKNLGKHAYIIRVLGQVGSMPFDIHRCLAKCFQIIGKFDNDPDSPIWKKSETLTKGNMK